MTSRSIIHQGEHYPLFTIIFPECRTVSLQTVLTFFRLISALASQEYADCPRLRRLLHERFNQTPLLSVPATSYASCCFFFFFLAPSRFKSGCCFRVSQILQALPVIHNQSHDSFNPACCCFRVPGCGAGGDATHLSHLMAVSDKPPAWLLSVSSPRYSCHY